MMEFYMSWEIRESSSEKHILEQPNVQKGEYPIRDWRILGMYKEKGIWILFRALDDSRGFFDKRILEAVKGSKREAISELQKYKD
jgi:hypothetical protein